MFVIILQDIAKQLQDIDLKLRKSLIVGHEDIKEATSILKLLTTLEVTRLSLKMCNIVATLKKVLILL